MARIAVWFLAVLPLAACSPKPDPAHPALWHAACPGSREAYLFGTVHALERPAQWRGPAIDRALTDADLLMVEIASLDDPKGQGAVFARLAKSPAHGPLSARIAADDRPSLLEILAKNGLADTQFDDTETWAAALMIAQAETHELDSAYGIDRAILAAADGKPVEELEGMEGQLRIFDRLPESEQRDLLAAIVRDANGDDKEATDLAQAWRAGDMAAIARETEGGMLADPELRQALFVGRNQRWTQRILAAMARGQRPFVAVGAAHLAGQDGVPAMLAAQGCRVSRTQ